MGNLTYHQTRPSHLGPPIASPSALPSRWQSRLPGAPTFDPTPIWGAGNRCKHENLLAAVPALPPSDRYPSARPSTPPPSRSLFTPLCAIWAHKRYYWLRSKTFHSLRWLESPGIRPSRSGALAHSLFFLARFSLFLSYFCIGCDTNDLPSDFQHVNRFGTARIAQIFTSAPTMSLPLPRSQQTTITQELYYPPLNSILPRCPSSLA